MIPYRSEINANCLVLHGVDWYMLMETVEELESSQFTCVADGDNTYRVTFPINDVISREYKAMIHRSRSENLLDKKNKNTDTDPDPKGTPPEGGTPGAGRVVEFENTVAIAA